jgi:uncharacterized membrane protein HdeD (DUF308 family)
MAGVLNAAANRVAPWREADWRVVVGEGALLILAGIYLLADGERAEFVLGLAVAAALLVDGGRQWLVGFRRLQRGRTRDLTLIRGAIGIVTGGLVLILSILQQVTVVGIRIAIGFGSLPYGLLGLVLGLPLIRTRQPGWTSMLFDVLLILLSTLLLYRVATGDTILGLLTVTSWLVIGSGIVLVAAGVVRSRRPRSPSDPASVGLPTT